MDAAADEQAECCNRSTEHTALHGAALHLHSAQLQQLMRYLESLISASLRSHHDKGRLPCVDTNELDGISEARVKDLLTMILTSSTQNLHTEAEIKAHLHAVVKQIVGAMSEDVRFPMLFCQRHLDTNELLEAMAASRDTAASIFRTISSHHARLFHARENTPCTNVTETPHESSWLDTVTYEHLQQYRDSSVEMSERAWLQEGFMWARDAVHEFFDGGGAVKRWRRFVRREQGKEGKALSASDDIELLATLERNVAIGRNTPLRLLDIGSCHNFFARFDDELQITALDLCPGQKDVYKCDFLQLLVGPTDSALECVASRSHPGHYELQQLPAAHFDVVVISLVLSYLPDPEQRSSMIVKARTLLRGPTPEHPHRTSLLIIIERLGADSGRRQLAQLPILKEWLNVMEQLGLRLYQYTRLRRAHALALWAQSPETSQRLPGLYMRGEGESVAAAT